MPQSVNQAETSEVSAVHENNLSMLDFSQCCLHLGVKIPGARWTQLDRDDWKVLYLLLTRSVLGKEAAVDYSRPLASLAEFSKAIVDWYETKEKEEAR